MSALPSAVRFRSIVTDEDTRPTLLGVDPSAPGFGTHLPFHLILERCGLAWRDFLSSLRGFGDSVIVPHLSADFIAEVHVGVIEVEVVPVHVGTTSFTLRCTMLQEEQQVARVDVVLVSFDYAGGSKTPLTESQRAQLLDLLT